MVEMKLTSATSPKCLSIFTMSPDLYTLPILMIMPDMKFAIMVDEEKAIIPAITTPNNCSMDSLTPGMFMIINNAKATFTAILMVVLERVIPYWRPTFWIIFLKEWLIRRFM